MSKFCWSLWVVEGEGYEAVDVELKEYLDETDAQNAFETLALLNLNVRIELLRYKRCFPGRTLGEVMEAWPCEKMKNPD